MNESTLQQLRIGLLTPYNGGNLGDGAIQEAVIANLRERHPGCSFHGFTLDPARTERLHHIPCSPLTVLSVPHYRLTVCSEEGDEAGGAERKLSLQRVKDLLKKNAALYRSLLAARRGAELASSTVGECRFIWRGCRILKDLDLLIVSGGGQLDDYWGGPWGHPFSLFKWGLMARLTRTPYLFLSVGTCSLESRLSRAFVKWALKWASYRSYRDLGSKALLDSIPFTRDDPVCPDLAFSLKLPPSPVKEVASRPVVGVSPIAYLSATWPRSDLGTYNPYTAALKSFVRFLLRGGAAVILYYTDTSDSRIVTEMAEELGKEGADSGGILAVRPTASVAGLLEVMAEVDYVVSSRLHGVILAHLMNKPVLAISYDRKVTAYMKEVEQEEYCLDIHRLDFDSLIGAFNSLRCNSKKAQTLIAGKSDRYRTCLAAQYDAALALAVQGSRPPAISEGGSR